MFPDVPTAMNRPVPPEMRPKIYSRLNSWALPAPLSEFELELELELELDRGATLSGMVFSPSPATSGIVACAYNATIRTWRNLGYETRSIPAPRLPLGESHSRAAAGLICWVSSLQTRSPETRARWELELGDCEFLLLFGPGFKSQSALISLGRV